MCTSTINCYVLTKLFLFFSMKIEPCVRTNKVNSTFVLTRRTNINIFKIILFYLKLFGKPCKFN